MPNLLDMKLGLLPPSEMSSSSAQEKPDPSDKDQLPKLKTFRSQETNLTVQVNPLPCDKFPILTESPQNNFKTIEKAPMKRVANSFSV